MVVLVNGVALEEPPRDIPAFLRQYSHFKEQASNLCSNKTEVVGPVGLLYVFQREFGATHPHDNKISVIGTDDVTTGHIVIIRHSGSGATCLCQLDKVSEDILTTMLQRVQSLSYQFEGRIQLHIIGGFADSRRVSHQLSVSLFNALHKLTTELDLVTCCIGELCTLNRNGTPWPVVYGVGVNVKTGDIFPAQFTDKGPDLDIRIARTLTGGENTGVLEVYDCAREELQIGPFTYEPMRAVDIWLQQTDEFLLQSLSPCPEVAPPLFIPHLRTTLKRIKDDPYPSVTVFHNNQPRYYRKEVSTGQWVRFHYKEEQQSTASASGVSPAAAAVAVAAAAAVANHHHHHHQPPTHPPPAAAPHTNMMAAAAAASWSHLHSTPQSYY